MAWHAASHNAPHPFADRHARMVASPGQMHRSLSLSLSRCVCVCARARVCQSRRDGVAYIVVASCAMRLVLGLALARVACVESNASVQHGTDHERGSTFVPSKLQRNEQDYCARERTAQRRQRAPRTVCAHALTRAHVHTCTHAHAQCVLSSPHVTAHCLSSLLCTTLLGQVGTPN